MNDWSTWREIVTSILENSEQSISAFEAIQLIKTLYTPSGVNKALQIYSRRFSASLTIDQVRSLLKAAEAPQSYEHWEPKWLNVNCGYFETKRIIVDNFLTRSTQKTAASDFVDLIVLLERDIDVNDLLLSFTEKNRDYLSLQDGNLLARSIRTTEDKNGEEKRERIVDLMMSKACKELDCETNDDQLKAVFKQADPRTVVGCPAWD